MAVTQRRVQCQERSFAEVITEKQRAGVTVVRISALGSKKQRKSHSAGTYVTRQNFGTLPLLREKTTLRKCWDSDASPSCKPAHSAAKMHLSERFTSLSSDYKNSHSYQESTLLNDFYNQQCEVSDFIISNEVVCELLSNKERTEPKTECKYEKLTAEYFSQNTEFWTR